MVPCISPRTATVWDKWNNRVEGCLSQLQAHLLLFPLYLSSLSIMAFGLFTRHIPPTAASGTLSFLYPTSGKFLTLNMPKAYFSLPSPGLFLRPDPPMAFSRTLLTLFIHTHTHIYIYTYSEVCRSQSSQGQTPIRSIHPCSKPKSRKLMNQQKGG